jgi:hypothetical protein
MKKQFDITDFLHKNKFRFVLNENQTNQLSNELKKHFLEIISAYRAYEDQMERPSDITEVAETLGGIVEAAKELALNEAGDWFDKVTIKRNMKELEDLGRKFDRFSVEARDLDTRLRTLYEDMGHILSRYYEIHDIDPSVMRQRLGMTPANVENTYKKQNVAEQTRYFKYTKLKNNKK